MFENENVSTNGRINPAMATAQFDRARLAERAAQGWITVTELADTLTRDHGVAFKKSHTIATRFVAESARRPSESRAQILRDVSATVIGAPVEYDDAALAEILDPRHFVRVRTTIGGPAPPEMTRAITSSRETLRCDERWLADVRARLAAADRALTDAAAHL